MYVILHMALEMGRFKGCGVRHLVGLGGRTLFVFSFLCTVPRTAGFYINFAVELCRKA